MIFEVINLFIVLLLFLLFVYGIVYFAKMKWTKSRKKNRSQEIKLLDKILKGFNSFFFFVGVLVNMLLKMLLAIFLAIGSKSLIYKLNAPLGEGYAIFASYVVAIGLYMIFPDFIGRKEKIRNENSKE